VSSRPMAPRSTIVTFVCIDRIAHEGYEVERLEGEVGRLVGVVLLGLAML